MANQKIIERKASVVEEIADKMKNSSSYILFEYRGLTVSETDELRRKLRETGSEYKVYKNTLTKRALDSLNVNLDEHLNGPKAIAFGTDAVAPIKVLSEFAKKHKALELKVGVVDGEIADQGMLSELAAIPSREGLLTMFAGGLLEHAKNFAICLDLQAKNLEENK
jgi:large subunit ribosomal protein L10